MNVLSQYTLGDMLLQYAQDGAGAVSLRLIPADMAGQIAPDDPHCAAEPLVQLKVLGDAYAGAFGCGVTMRDSATVAHLRYLGQAADKTEHGLTVNTRLDCEGLELIHTVEWDDRVQALRAAVTVRNQSGAEKTLELLASLTLGMLTPFETGMHEENLNVYRMRSRWANEGVLEKRLAEELLLVPSTLYEEIYTVRYGHIGNKPTNNFIPFAAVEDIARGVLWGMQLAVGSSWQIEFSRRDNGLSVSGGLADADFGSWMKKLAPGEAFTTPDAFFTVCRGDIDDLCHRLTGVQNLPLAGLPEGEAELPVIFNEWCTSWGCPDEKNMQKLCARLQGWPVRYLVMDAGWYKDAAHEWFEKTGDWIPSKEKYPGGFKAVCDHIRKAGFIPGMWFEIETCGVLSEAWHMDDHLLRRHGLPLIAKGRKFWDFRDERVWAYMCERVIGLMKEAGIGYIKVDSNESIGAGCDGAESLGEGLRQQIARVEDFLREMRRQIPDLVIENCSSGGHRLVSNFMGVSSVASFSDAFESDDIPIIAANLHRIILPRQSEVWCIVRHTDDEKHLRYKLASGFLGRVGMSGTVYDLDDQQCAVVLEGLEKYQKSVPVIRDGFSRRYGPAVVNYRHPKGWQAVARTGGDGGRMLVVIHRFDGDKPEIAVPLDGDWAIDWHFKRDAVRFEIREGKLLADMPEPMEGAAVMLRRTVQSIR